VFVLADLLKLRDFFSRIGIIPNCIFAAKKIAQNSFCVVFAQNRLCKKNWLYVGTLCAIATLSKHVHGQARYCGQQGNVVQLQVAAGGDT